MSEACYTAKATLRTATKDLVSGLALQRNNNGQYQHDAIMLFKTGIERKLAEIYNPLVPGEGMKQLLIQTPNLLNSIKSTDNKTPDELLRSAKNQAALLSTSSGQPIEPTIKTRAEAIDEADRINYAYQATIGTKMGVADAITEKVGKDITDPILRTADGTDYKSVDDWSLHELMEAAIAGAINPNYGDILSHFNTLIHFKFDFRKTITTNMEQLRAAATRVNVYDALHTEAHMALQVLANIEEAVQHGWGREFRTPLHTIRQKYRYNHKHTAASLTAILTLLSAVDAVRNLSDAPPPNQSNDVANSITEATNILSQIMQESMDFEEVANAALSDSESSGDKHRRGRGGKRGKSGERGKSRTGSKSNDTNDKVRNTCPHCKVFKRRLAHPNVPEAKCHWNPKRKCYRQRWICDEMEIAFKPRHKFSADMGGYPDDGDNE